MWRGGCWWWPWARTLQWWSRIGKKKLCSWTRRSGQTLAVTEMTFFCGTTRVPKVAWRKRCDWGDRVLISFFGEGLILVRVTTETKGRTIKATMTMMIPTEVRAIPVHWSRGTISNRGICLPLRMGRKKKAPRGGADHERAFRKPRRERREEGRRTALSDAVWSAWARNWAKLLPSLICRWRCWWSWT